MMKEDDVRDYEWTEREEDDKRNKKKVRIDVFV